MDENNSVNDEMVLKTNHVVWTKDHERILIDWGDKAMCYRWLHSKSHSKYSRTNAY